ncbi:MAG: hypothetical protein RXR18_04805 [Nitrososphaeria archaeon]
MSEGQEQAVDEPVSLTMLLEKVDEAILLARGVSAMLNANDVESARYAVKMLVNGLEYLKSPLKKYKPEYDIDEYVLDELCNYRCTPLPSGGVTCT